MTMRVSGWKEEEQVTEAEVEELEARVRWLLHADVTVNPLLTEAGWKGRQ